MSVSEAAYEALMLENIDLQQKIAELEKERDTLQRLIERMRGLIRCVCDDREEFNDDDIRRMLSQVITLEIEG